MLASARACRRGAQAAREAARAAGQRRWMVIGVKKQQLQLYRSLWGVEGVDDGESRDTIFEWLQKEHYHGVEFAPALVTAAGGEPRWEARRGDANAEARASLSEAAWKHHLDLIATVKTCGDAGKDASVEQHLESLEEQAEVGKEMGVIALNIHGGSQAWDAGALVKFAAGVAEVEARTGVQCMLETHRERALSSPWKTKELMAACDAQGIPLQINVDLSHWCHEGENLFSTTMDKEFVEDLVAELAIHVHHIHARVGWHKDGHIPDPRKKEYSLERKTHDRWWDILLAGMLQRKAPPRIMPTFGPELFSSTDPSVDGKPPEDVWEINSFLCDMHRARWAARYGCCGCCGPLCFYRRDGRGQKGY